MYERTGKWNRIVWKAALLGDMSMPRHALKNVPSSHSMWATLLVLTAMLGLFGCSTHAAYEPDSGARSTLASAAQPENFPIEVSFDVPEQGNNFNLHLSRIQVASQVGNRGAEAGTVFLIIYYDVESEAKSGSYPASLMTRQFEFYCGNNTHYGTVLDALSDLSVDGNLLKNGETVESLATNLQPGVKKRLATIYQVPVSQLTNNPRLKIYDDGFKEIKLTALSNWATSQLPHAQPPSQARLSEDSEAVENGHRDSSPNDQENVDQFHQKASTSSTKEEEQVVEQDNADSSIAVAAVQKEEKSDKQANDFSTYEADLDRRIRRAWFPPMGHKSERVVVTFMLGAGGELSDLSVTEPSDDVIANQAALKAAENAAPFRSVPSAIPAPIWVRFTFDYNKYAGGGKSEIIRVAE